MRKLALLWSVILLSGCVGITITAPEKQKILSYDDRHLLKQEPEPVISKVVIHNQRREWCGATLWALGLPIPLKLPVCQSFEETSYGVDNRGRAVPLVISRQEMQSPFYGCGPLMGLSAIIHGYKGNIFCGMLP